MGIGAGIRFGPYEVQSALGAGGMGEVYRARDSRLRREVALKVLPESFASEPDRLARFQREAEVLASLNHPHIAGIYGIEEQDGIRALVLELVEGETLAERIGRGPIPVDETLSIARQIAEAVAAAHEKGIIHRDLKPANIKVTAEGAVKVLDFGLAKIAPPRAADAATATASNSPTITSPAHATGVGVLLGTAAYMSPEQAKGKPADKRSDVWAFGCVLFEMLTSRRAFQGDDVGDTLAAILRGEPDWGSLPAHLPSPVGALLKGCLEKDRHRRIADLAVAVFAFEHLATLGTAASPTVRASVSRRAAVLTSVIGLSAVALAGAAGWWLSDNPVPRPVVRSEITTVGAASLRIQGTDRDVAITPDGQRIVYRGSDQLLVRRLDQLEPVALGRLGSTRGPFVSPDGESVGYFDSNGLLRRIPISGGPPTTVASFGGDTPRGATWGPDGSIVFATNAQSSGLMRVAATGGDVEVLTTRDRSRNEADHAWPDFLPDGKAVLFTILPTTGGIEASQIAVLDLETRQYKVLLRDGSHARYVATGHLIYGTAGTVRAARFDLDRREIIGAPAVVLNERLTTGDGALDLDIAANGTLVYVGFGGNTVERSLVWVDRDGREEMVPIPPRAYRYVRVSPDGSRLALDVRDQDYDVWIFHLGRQTLTRLTFDPALDGVPVWSADGARIIFASQRLDSAGSLFSQAADGTGSAERLTEASSAQLPLAVSPGSASLLLRETNPKTVTDLMLLQLLGRRGGPTASVVQTPFNEPNGDISPNGRWVAYESYESGQAEVYVQPFPDVTAGRWQISSGGGRMPVWARDSRELFYVAPDDVLMGVQVESSTSTSWSSTTPVRILAGAFMYNPGNNGRTFGGAAGRAFDVAPDGRRFVMIKPAGSTAADTPRIMIVQNWFEELNRLVPAK